MTKQEKQMLKSVSIAMAYGAGKQRMKKVYRGLYPRIKARKRIQLIKQAGILRQEAKSLTLRRGSTLRHAVQLAFTMAGGCKHEAS